MKKRNIKIKRWYKNNKKVFWMLLFLIMFPLVVGGIYSIPIPRLIAVEFGDLIAYYGTVFGIIGSFIIYWNEIKKRNRERKMELKPIFTVEVGLIDESQGLFQIDINKHSESPLSFFYFYDEFISTKMKEKYSFRVTYNKTNKEIEIIKPQYNIMVDSDIIDSDGYPKYIQLICDDKDGNAWNCCYRKVKDCGKIYYYPSDFEML